MAEEKAPIIIKRIKKSGGGHHGGAWKVAYADFVTAMMAFFLLLWLLSATSKETKDGIAEYFSPEVAHKAGSDEDSNAVFFTPTMGISGEKGVGVKGGKKPFEDGTKIDDKTPASITTGRAPQGPLPESPKKALVEADAEANLFDRAEAEIRKALQEDASLSDYNDNVVIEQSPEGLKIDIIDDGRRPMFEAGGAELSGFGKILLGRMAGIIVKMPNYISVTGHTDGNSYNRGDKYTNWELSADRANAARRFLRTTKLEPERVAKVIGMADHDPLVKEDPKSPRNRRITLIMLRGSHLLMPEGYESAPRGLLAVPKATDQKQQITPLGPNAPIPVPASSTEPPSQPIQPLSGGTSPFMPGGNISPSGAPILPATSGQGGTDLPTIPGAPSATTNEKNQPIPVPATNKGRRPVTQPAIPGGSPFMPGGSIAPAGGAP